MDLVSQSYVVTVNGDDLKHGGAGINLTTRVLPVEGEPPPDEYYLVLCEDNDFHYYIERSQLENMKVGERVFIDDKGLIVVKVKDSDGSECVFDFYKLLRLTSEDVTA